MVTGLIGKVRLDQFVEREDDRRRLNPQHIDAPRQVDGVDVIGDDPGAGRRHGQVDLPGDLAVLELENQRSRSVHRDLDLSLELV